MDRRPPLVLDPAWILFVDDDVVAVDKPPGVLCDASIDPRREHLGTALRHWAGNDAEFFPAHRLDLGTSGVVLFARSRTAATALMQQFQARSVSKRYQAIVQRPDDDAWQIGHTFERRSYLRHRKGTSEEVRSGGKPAATDFEVLDVADGLALVKASPATGRTHQLRVHLAAVDAPIVGDDRYGPSPTPEAARLWLHADTLSLAHPVTGEPLTLQSRRTLALERGSPVERSVANTAK